MKSKSLRPRYVVAGLIMLLTTPLNAAAEGFSILVAPPRFELQANPGDVVRDHVEITNPGDSPVTFLIRTADWDMTEAGTATFYPPELRPGSCRPWVRIERHKVHLPAKASKRYRFQLEVPEGTPPGECRFALLIEAPPEDAVKAQARSLTLPVRGRIAIVVYVMIGSARPVLEVRDIVLENSNEKLTPVAIVENTGNAHGRTGGYFEANDTTGKRIDFAVTPLPILAGQTRHIPLYQPTIDDRAAVDFTPPLDLSGTLEWNGGSKKIEQRLTTVVQ